MARYRDRLQMTDSTEALRRGLAGIGDGFGSVVAAFHAAVGPELARVATPSSLKRGTLTVRCSSASWAQTLTMMELDLVERLAPRLGKGTVTRIVARAGGPPPPLEPTREAPLEPLDAASEASCEALVADIADPELRARVLAAAKASARRRIREGNSRS